MTDQGQPPVVLAQQGGPPSPAARKRSFAAGLASSVARHSYVALALIVVLVILAIGLYVYYHGFLFLGPYAKGARHGSGARAKKGAGASAGAGDGAGDGGDPETERLIDTINRQ